MIPKIIHYCWFGKAPKTEFAEKCITTWQEILPEYEIKEWNESNCDIWNSCEFVREAYLNKKWAFVSDYFRLKALNDYGGIYFDTDVQVIKSFDNLLSNKFFCCFESEGYLCTAVIGAEKGNSIISSFLSSYSEMRFTGDEPNSSLLFKQLIGESEYDLNSVYNLSNGETIFPRLYFSPKDFYTKKVEISTDTYAIHHFDGTWKNGKQKFKDSVQNFLIKIMGKEKYFKLKGKSNEEKR